MAEVLVGVFIGVVVGFVVARRFPDLLKGKVKPVGGSGGGKEAGSKTGQV